MVNVVWAGKQLSADEELQLRRTVALLRRIEERGGTEEERALSAEARMNIERFLPENDHRWTPNELETGIYLGPWMVAEAQVNPWDPGPTDTWEEGGTA
jgi:hypothetical protein